jgi:hypothetical protein
LFVSFVEIVVFVEPDWSAQALQRSFPQRADIIIGGAPKKILDNL